MITDQYLIVDKLEKHLLVAMEIVTRMVATANRSPISIRDRPCQSFPQI